MNDPIQAHVERANRVFVELMEAELAARREAAIDAPVILSGGRPPKERRAVMVAAYRRCANAYAAVADCVEAAGKLDDAVETALGGRDGSRN